MTTEDVTSALALATLHSQGAPFAAPIGRARAFRRTVAIGDPQTSLERFFTVLAHHKLLDPRGRLRDDTRLIVMGDYFDWGAPAQRRTAAADGLRLLAWIAMHPPEQVIALTGNHDLARVGELAHFSDALFAQAQREADRAYLDKDPERKEALFCEDYNTPSWELIARDFSVFRETQRTWITSLLRAGRLHLAWSEGGVLFTHAGVSRRELTVLGLDPQGPQDPDRIADGLNAALLKAVRRWTEGPLYIPDLHHPGDHHDEGVGMLYHRFTVEPVARPKPESMHRRTSVYELPRGLLQAIGHVRDKKSRALLGQDVSRAHDGPLRLLRVSDSALRYGPLEAPSDTVLSDDTASVWHLDGGMSHADLTEYSLLDVHQRASLTTLDRAD
ncbi:MAG: metallophosphoesterase [Deltaproteobacteria bacterium]|nr:metallophosphoesterase [Deltaproteobacteria bacterium]